MDTYYKTLIQVKHNQPVTTSLNVADVFGKNHRDVMRNIKNLTAQNYAVKNMFVKGTYVNKRNQTWPMYYMNKDGFSILVMGFTGKRATKFKLDYISAFNAMQKQLSNQNPISSLINAPKSKILSIAAKTERQHEKDLPKVHYYDKSMRNPGTMTTTVIAKDYGMSAWELNRLLNKLGIIYKQGKSWVLYSKYQDLKLGSYDSYNYDNNRRVNENWKWNQRGKKFIHDLLYSHGYRLNAEQLNLINHQVNQIRRRKYGYGN